MTLQEKIEKQQQLLDDLPGEEGRNILVCSDCSSFVYMQPVTREGVCRGCGDTYTEEVRVRNL